MNSIFRSYQLPGAHALRPSQVSQQIAPFAPGESPEFLKADALRVKARVSLDPPAQVGTAPRRQPVAASERPKSAKHFTLTTTWRRHSFLPGRASSRPSFGRGIGRHPESRD